MSAALRWIMCVLTVALMSSSTGALAATPPGEGLVIPGTPLKSEPPVAKPKHGLPASISLPAWAVGTHAHFFADRSAATIGSGAGLAQPMSELGPRCGPEYCPEPPLLYKSGKGVQHTPKLYVIFWGKNWEKAPGSELKTQLLKMYEGLSGSAYQGILTQYFDSTGRISATVTVSSYIDTSVIAPTAVNDKALQEEVSKAIKAKGWTREANAQFVVIPAPGTTYATGFDTGFCGYHSVTTEGESSYTLVPYIGEEPFKKGCIAYDPHENANNVTSMVAAHEYAESATDPAPEGAGATWQDSQGFEIGDICISGDDELPNGSFVQGLWDDHQNACSLSDANPPHVYTVTEGPSNLTRHEATLNGSANAEGTESRYHIEYGATTSYGTNLPVPDALFGSGVSNQSLSQNVGGLSLETPYHYRLTATNSTGTTSGEDHVVVTTRWAIQPTANPSGSGPVLEGVSCAAAEACIAVGNSQEAGGRQSLAERWNGTEWSTQTVPLPTGGKYALLASVSCSSATACTAVGEYETSSAVLPLAERWNGTTWSAQTPPAPAGPTNLRGVSCASSTACTAIGLYENSEHRYRVVAERWNGTEWTLQTPPNPKETIASVLNAVACSAAEACTAVGYAESSSGRAALVERWSAGEWAVQTTPSPSGSAVVLHGVACPSATSCAAVGTYRDASNNQVTLAESWNGTEWKTSTPPNPTGGTTPILSGVACTASSVCTAVGSYLASVNNANIEAPLAENWNGTSWSIEATPLFEQPAHNRKAIMLGASCLTSGCTAVGQRIDVASEATATLAENRAMIKPYVETNQASAISPAEATLNGVVSPEGASTKYFFEYGTTTSYGTKTAEVSIGSGIANLPESKTITGLQQSTLYHFRIVASNSFGTSLGSDHTFTTSTPSWKIASLATPTGTLNKYIGGVSCTSSSACTTIGDYELEASPGLLQSLAERWNGSEWKIQSSPNPSGAKRTVMGDLACSSSTACMAVGYYQNAAGAYLSLAMSWNGSEWKILSTPEPSGTVLSYLWGISCTSASACTAVGEYENSSKAASLFAERWNGSEWTLQSTPNPSGARESNPWGVSCTSATACAMAGYYENSSGTHLPFAESWNGSEWKVQTTPNPSGSSATEIRGISCTAANACTIVGDYKNSAGTWVTLAERWNGTEWAIQTSPNPAEAKASYLNGGVACTSSTSCIATGDSLNSAGHYVTLAERWTGSEWQLQSTPNDEKGEGALSAGISCISPTSCVAVGQSFSEIYG